MRTTKGDTYCSIIYYLLLPAHPNDFVAPDHRPFAHPGHFIRYVVIDVCAVPVPDVLYGAMW